VQASMSEQSVRGRKRRRRLRLLSRLNDRYDPPFSNGYLNGLFDDEDDQYFDGALTPLSKLAPLGLSKLSPKLALLQEGIKLGMIPARKGAQMLQEGWLKAWKEANGKDEQQFNLERVFWRIVFAVGLFMILKAIWHIYRGGIAIVEFGKIAVGVEPPKNLQDVIIQTIFAPGWGLPTLIHLISNQGFPGTSKEDEKNVLEKIQADPLSILDKVFIDYWVVIVMGIILVVLFLEFQASLKGKALLGRIFKNIK